MAEFKFKSGDVVKFSPNIDYQALINKEKLKGTDINKTLIDQYQRQRSAKIYSNPDFLSKYEDTIPDQYKNTMVNAPPQAAPTASLTPPTAGTTQTAPTASLTASLTAPPTQTPTTPQQPIPQQPIQPIQPVQQVSTAPTTAPAPYQSQYQQDISNQLKMLSDTINNKPQYNPANDAGLQAAQTQAMNAVTRAMSRRNMLSGTTTQAQMNLSAGALTPQYQQLAEQAYQNAVQNRLNALQQTNVLDTTAYGQYQGQRELGQGDRGLTQKDIGLTQTNRELGQGDRRLDQSGRQVDIQQQQADIQQQAQNQAEATQQAQLTGRYNTPEQLAVLKGGISAVPQDIVNKVMSYANQDGGIQAYINTLDQNSPEFVQANLVRNRYLSENPQLGAKYNTSANVNIGQETIGRGTLTTQQRQQQSNENQQHSTSTGQYLTPNQYAAIDQPIPDQVINRVMSFVGKDGGIQGYINTLDKNSTEYIQAVMLRNKYIAENPEVTQPQTPIGQRTVEAKQIEDTTQINKANLVGFLDVNKNNKIDENELKTLSAQELDQRINEFAQSFNINKAELMGFLDTNGNNKIDPGEETLAKQTLNENVNQFNQQMDMEQQKLNLSKEQFEQEYGIKLADLMGGFDFNNNGVIDENEYTQRAKEFEKQLGVQEGAMIGSYTPTTSAANPANQSAIPTLDSTKVMSNFAVAEVPYKENTNYLSTYSYINDIATKAKGGKTMVDKDKIANFREAYDNVNGKGKFDKKYKNTSNIKFVDYTKTMIDYLTQPDIAMQYINSFGKDGITGYKDILKTLKVKEKTMNELFADLNLAGM